MPRRRSGRPLLALLAAALAVAVGAPAGALPRDTWVVAIGNDRGGPREVELLYAERDARQLAEVLERLGGVAPTNVTLLAGDDVDVVRRSLQQVNLEIRARSAAGPTALVVYYSGHADARSLHLDGGELPLDELKALVGGSPAAVRLLIVDACRSGNVTRVKGVTPSPEFVIDLQDHTAVEGEAIITSSAAGETSQESDRLRGSFFTHHLVNGLRGAADENGDGKVTLDEAYAYAYAQTLRSTGETLALQHPTYSYDVRGKGELVLSRTGVANGNLGRLRLAEATRYLVREDRGGGAVVAEVAPERANAVLALRAARYKVEERLPTEYREYEVQLAPGTEVSLRSLPYRALRYDRLVRRRGGDSPPTHGLMLLAGARGPVLSGEGASPGLILGYGLDLPWFTVGLRLRAGTASGTSVDGALAHRHDELAAGLALERFVDFRELSLFFGIVGEAALHFETFSGARPTPDRLASGGSFGGLVGLERTLAGGLALHLEGGPTTLLLERTSVDANGLPGSATFISPISFWAAAGLVWRF